MRGILIKISRLPNEIKRNVGNCNILFQDWSMRTPLAVAVTENKRVVGKVQEIVDFVG